MLRLIYSHDPVHISIILVIRLQNYVELLQIFYPDNIWKIE